MAPSATTAPTLRSAKRPGVTIEYAMRGDGPPVVMLPGAARGAEDFNALAAVVTQHGYRAVQPHPRGLGGSRGPMEGVTLADLAADVALVVEHLGVGPVTLVGHALGQRIARLLAATRPDLVNGVVLLACGGKVQPDPSVFAIRARATDPTVPLEERRAATAAIYFAPGNDPSGWIAGWHKEIAPMQEVAARTAPLADWWTAGNTVPLLVVQGRQDIFAPPENGRLLKAEVGDRATLVDLDRAGHALIFEQPEAIATLVLDFLAKVAPVE